MAKRAVYLRTFSRPSHAAYLREQRELLHSRFEFEQRLVISAIMISSALLLIIAPSTYAPAPALVYDHDGWIYTAAADGTGEKRLTKGDCAAWSPDHSRVVVAKARQLVITTLGGGEKALWTSPPSTEITGVTWGPAVLQERDVDGQHRRPGTSIIFAVDSGQGSSLFQLVPERPGKPEELEWLGGFSGLRRFETGTPAWSPKGSKLAFSLNGDLWVAQSEAPGEGAQGGWYVTRVDATAQYDGGTFYASHWTSVIDRIAWSRDETTIAFHTRRIGGTGILDLFVGRISSSDAAFASLVDKRRVSEECGWFAFAPGTDNLVFQSLGWASGKAGVRTISVAPVTQ